MAEKLLIDQYCTCGGEIVNDKILYSCTLNQTDLKTNKNKFYIMQLLRVNTTTFHLFIRYGRIGERGTVLNDTFGNIQAGESAFASQFKKKTGNIWKADVYQTFQQKKGKYFLTMIDVSDIDIPPDSPFKEVKSELDERTQFLIQLLSNKDMMQKSLVSLNLDTKKMPLGKIGKSQIIKAREIMGEINTHINSGSTNISFTDLSSQFYTLIPYSVGRRTPPVIDNMEIIGKYMNLLDELEHIAATATIINDSATDVADINPIDKIYNELNAEISPLDKDGKMWKVINEYVKIASTHNYNVQVLDIYNISRNGEKEVFDDHCRDIDNRMLLWHGSGLSNWCSIIKNGFRLPNTLKGVVLTGWMFGPGTYFSNMFSKSFGYTRYHDFDNYACLLLSEVALGTQYKITDAEYDIDKDKLTAKGCHSTYGMGATTTKIKYKIDGDVSIPAGDMVKTTFKSSLLYDEFIVYDVKQIRQKYLVIVKNT